jgi:hypothetical protein
VFFSPWVHQLLQFWRSAMMGRLKVPLSSRRSLGVLCVSLLGIAGWGQSSNLAAAPSTSSSARATFVVARSFAVSGNPTSVAAGDLNGDGKSDLAITKSGSSGVTVLLGNGSGGFAPGVEYPAGNQPGNVLLADVNGDGKLDIVVTDAVSGSVDVLLGKGDGTFGAASPYAAIANPVALTLGNFYGNGKDDLAVASATGVVVLRNDASGHYSAGAEYPISGQPVSLTASDLAGSGHDDLVVGNQDGTVNVLMGDGTGHFNALPVITAGTGAISAVVAGDFNGDGVPDVALAQANAGQVTVLLGKGDGTFQAGVSYGVGNNPTSLIAANLNGTGATDLVAVNHAANTFSVLMGNGDGTFQATHDYVAGNGPLAVAAGNFYSSGNTDLAIVNYGDGTISVPAGLGDGTFKAARSYLTGLERKAIAAGDLNGDGISDLVVTNYCGNDGSCTGNGNAAVFLGNADQTYRLGSTYTLGSGPVAVSLADVNGDGKLDLLAVNRNDKTLMVMLGNGDGTFGKAQTISLSGSPNALYVADFNGDGKKDVAIASDCGQATCTQAGTVDIWLGNGDGTFTKTNSYPVGYSPVSIAGGALSSNGYQDLAVANACGQDATCKSGGTATILVGDGTGKFTQSGEVSLGQSPSSIALAKLGGGSNLNLIVAERGSNQVAVLPGDGSGGFGPAASYAVGTAPAALAVADLNGDGANDVAVANFQSSTVSVLYGTSSGTLQSPVTYTVGTGPESMAVVTSGNVTGTALVTANGNSGSTPMGNGITALATTPQTPPAATNTTMTLTPPATNCCSVNQQYVLSATVTTGNGANATAVTTGTVNFALDFGGNGTLALADCQNVAYNATAAAFTCTTQLLLAGSNNVQAQYSGDPTNNLASSTSADVAQNSVAQTGSQILTVLNNSETPYTVDVPINVTAAVEPNPIPATATDVVPFDFQAPGGTAGTATMDFVSPASGNSIATDCSAVAITNNSNAGTANAACTTASLAANTYSITAKYHTASGAGDANYSDSGTTNISTSVTVNTAPTQTMVNSAYATGTTSAPTAYQATTLTATVSPTASGSVLPVKVPFSGSMSFYLDGSATAISGCGAATVDSTQATGGVATCSISGGLSGGAHSITATYDAAKADTSYISSSSGGFSVTVQTIATSVTVSADAGNPANPTLGDSLKFNATVTPLNASVPFSNSGTVTFTDTTTGTVLCSAAPITVSTGVASCTTSALGIGSNVISAAYNGDTNYAATQTGNITTYTQAIIAAATHSLASSQNPVAPNTNVTFTETVTGPSGGPQPSGSVAFDLLVNGVDQSISNACDKVTLSSGVATCTTKFSNSGNQTVVATYSGDTDFSGATDTLVQGIGTISTTTSITAPTVLTSTVNAPVAFSVLVTPVTTGGPALNGSVTIASNGNTICIGTIDAATNTFSCSSEALTLGQDSVTATYNQDGGDTNYGKSTSSPTTINVSQGSSSVSLSSSANPSVVKTQLTFTANVTVPSGPAGTLSGGVTFTALNTANSTTATLCNNASINVISGSSTGTATCPATLSAVAPYTITASYGGNADFQGSNTSISQTVAQAATTTAFVSPPTNSTVNQPVTLSVLVTGPQGTTQYTGTVTITDNGATVCSGLSVSTNGAAQPCNDTRLVAGAHTITASYVGDATLGTSSASITLGVNPASSTIAVVSSVNPSVVPNPNNVNDTVTFTATVMPNAGAVQLSGFVTFTNNGLSLPECPTPVAVNPATGQAACTTSSLTAGVDTILAVYSNDPNYLTSSGVATPAQTVQDYSLVVSSTPPVELSQGYTSSTDLFTPQTMSVAPISVQGFSTASGKPLALTCAVTTLFSPASSPTLPVCKLASSGLAVSGTGAQGATGLVMDATNASAGLYSVQVSGVDPTTGLKRSSQAFDAIVRSASSPLTLVSGATTGNTGNLTFLLPAGVSLSNLVCQSVSGPNLTGSVSPASLGITCAFNPTTIAASSTAQAAQVTVTVGTSGSTTTTAANARHTNLWMAGLLGLPFFGLVGLIGGRKSSRSVYFRLMVIMVICVMAFQVVGCGGSFSTQTANSSGGGGKTPPGVYNVLVVGTGSDGQTYEAVLQLNVQL